MSDGASNSPGNQAGNLAERKGDDEQHHEPENRHPDRHVPHLEEGVGAIPDARNVARIGNGCVDERRNKPDKALAQSHSGICLECNVRSRNEQRPDEVSHRLCAVDEHEIVARLAHRLEHWREHCDDHEKRQQQAARGCVFYPAECLRYITGMLRAKRPYFCNQAQSACDTAKEVRALRVEDEIAGNPMDHDAHPDGPNLEHYDERVDHDCGNGFVPSAVQLRAACPFVCSAAIIIRFFGLAGEQASLSPITRMLPWCPNLDKTN